MAERNSIIKIHTIRSHLYNLNMDKGGFSSHTCRSTCYNNIIQLKPHPQFKIRSTKHKDCNGLPPAGLYFDSEGQSVEKQSSVIYVQVIAYSGRGAPFVLRSRGHKKINQPS